MSICREGIFVANRHNYAQLTNIHYWDDSGSIWSPNLIGTTYPRNLLPDPPALDDLVLFGIDYYAPGSRQFSSLVFDIAQALEGVTTAWRMDNGGAGSGLDPQLWPAFSAVHPNTCDTTMNDGVLLVGDNSLNTLGVCQVVWDQIDIIARNPTIAAVPLGVYGYWMCLHVTAITGALQTPQQQNREIYTITWPYIDVTATDIQGDLPAVPRFTLKNESDGGGVSHPLTQDPSLYQNKVFIGSRSLTRRSIDCSDFSAFLNFSDEQNPLGVTYNDLGGGAHSVISSYDSATGRVVEIDGAVATQTGVAGRIEVAKEYAPQYYGKYHMYLLVKMLGSGGTYVVGDAELSVIVATSREGGSYETITQDIPLVDEDHVVMDFGEVSIGSPDQLLSSEQTEITISVRYNFADALVPGPYPDLLLYSVVIMPVDEWAGEFVSPHQSTKGMGWRSMTRPVPPGSTAPSAQEYIMPDGYGIPKVGIRCPMFETYDSDGIESHEVLNMWSSYGTPPRFVPNIIQRIWFFTQQQEYSLYSPYPNIFRAPPESAMSVELRVQQRYSSMRGDR